MKKLFTFPENLSSKRKRTDLRITLLLILLNIVFGNFVFGQNITNEETSVLGPTVPTISATQLPEDFNYIYGYGPSEPQESRVTGINLSPLEDTLTFAGPTNYEISFDNVTFSDTLKINYTGGSLELTPLYIRLKAGLDAGNYNGESVIIAGGSAPDEKIQCLGSVTAAIYWDGGANTSNWSDAANWQPNGIPKSSEAVVLNNIYVTGTYNVNIGTSNASIKALIISPNSENTITLTLTSANTGTPGLQVGDNNPISADINIYDGGVLINNSNAPSGNSIAFTQPETGILKINNGGKYIHKSRSAHSNLISRLSVAMYTELGIFEFDVPMTSNYALTLNGYTIGTLSLVNSAEYNYTTSGVSSTTIRGNLMFNFSSTGTINSTEALTFNLTRNFINSGSDITFTNQIINFNGLNYQTISGVGGVTFNNIILDNPSGLLLNRNININGTLTLTNGAFRTGSNSITFGQTATNPAEDTAAYILGTTITIERNVGTGSFTFLGININPGIDNLGFVTTTRTTGSPVIYNGYEGISCKWDISSDLQPVNGRTVDYSWCSVFDNNKEFTTNFGQVWKSEDNGATWLLVVDSVLVSGDPRTITATDSSFSLWTVTSSNSPLPVTLQSFTYNLNQRNVKLNWVTETEINNSGFEVQKTEVRNQETGVWNKIGFIQGKGNSNEPVSYTYEDKNIQTGKYKYRLKQIDNNGNFEYFELAGIIDVGIPAKYDLSQNYPNPFNPVTKINFDIPESGLVTMKVYDILGREAATIMNEMKEAGYYTITFDASKLSSGVYFYRLSSKSFSSVKRLVVLK